MPLNARTTAPLLLALLFAWAGCRAAPAVSLDQGGTTDRPDLATPAHYDFTIRLGTTADPHYIAGEGTIWSPCDATGRGLPIGLHFDPPGPMALRLNGDAISDSLDFIVVWPTAPCERVAETTASPIEAQWSGQAGDGLRVELVEGQPSWTADHWPDRARTYLPVADHPSRTSGWRFRIVAPARYAVIASGASFDPPASPESTSLEQPPLAQPSSPTRVHRPSAAFPAKAVSFVAAPLARVLDAGRIQAYASANEADAFAQTVASAPRVLAWMVEQIGPLPVDTLRIVRADTRYRGMENAGLIVLSDMPDGRDAELLLAHEIAHQWFGTAASEERWRDLWLSEGAATWWAVRYGESRWGAEWADAQREEWSRIDVDQAVDSAAHPDDLLADSYALGAARLDALAREIGDAAMLRTLRRMVQADADGARPVLSAERLRRIVADVSRGDTRPRVHLGW